MKKVTQYIVLLATEGFAATRSFFDNSGSGVREQEFKNKQLVNTNGQAMVFFFMGSKVLWNSQTYTIFF